MAITQRDTGGIKEYFGLSGDAKPTTNVPAGSTFFETNTGDTYVFDGSAWSGIDLATEGANTELTTADLDTGGGTDARAVVGLVGSASGGGQLIAGDTTNGLDVDVTRTPWSSALTMTHTQPSATTTSGAMLAANASRKYALLQNIGSVDVFVKIAATAVASQGIRLAANGGSYEVSAAFGNLMTGAINGITTSGTATVLVTEGV